MKSPLCFFMLPCSLLLVTDSDEDIEQSNMEFEPPLKNREKGRSCRGRGRGHRLMRVWNARANIPKNVVSCGKLVKYKTVPVPHHQRFYVLSHKQLVQHNIHCVKTLQWKCWFFFIKFLDRVDYQNPCCLPPSWLSTFSWRVACILAINIAMGMVRLPRTHPQLLVNKSMVFDNNESQSFFHYHVVSSFGWF